MKKPPSTKVMEIFSEAAATPDAQRPGFLDHLCEGDAELRAEVESLLNAQQHVGEFLDAPLVEELGTPADGPDPLERDQVLVGRFAILARVGEGGFGVVYRARQTFPIRREVALKILKLGMDTRQIIARFESERQTLALMDHSNIARILDAGATNDGRPYFALELVRGSPITEYCDARRLTIPQRLDLFTCVCQAVQHAHQKGIIHRDLKPSNILVAEIDGVAVPKVIDFGIAKAIEPRPGGRTALTELRHFVGTPQYMSPEQAGANNGDVDTRSDIYSLGALLYELLTGATPFESETLRDLSFEQVQTLVREKDPPRPSARLSASGPTVPEIAGHRGTDASRLRRTVSGELDWVVMKAIEKDRRRRYETAGDLAEDVRRFLAQEPLLAGPPDTLYRMRKFARRHRRPLLVAATIMLALFTGLGGTIYGLVRAKQDRDRAEDALGQAQQVSTFLADMLRSADPDRIQGKEVSLRSLLDRTVRRLDDGALKEQPLVEAQTRMAIARAYDSLGLFPESGPQVRRAFALREQNLGPENRETLQSMVAVSAAISSRANYYEAETICRRALAIQEKTLGPEHPDLIPTLTTLGLILRGNGDNSGSVPVLQRCVELTRRHGTKEQTAAALTNLAVALLSTGDYDGAEPLFREALAADRQLHGERFRNVPRNLSNIAVILEARGDLKGAEANWREALRIQRDMLPAEHPDIGWTLRLLGRVERAQGELGEAEKFTRESLAMERKIFGATHPVVAMVLEELGLELQLQGRHDEARSVRQEMMGILTAHEASSLRANPKSALHREAVGELHLRRGEFLEAQSDIAEAVRLGPHDPHPQMVRACLSCYMDDQTGYRQVCRELLDRFGRTPDLHLATWISLEGMLAPPDPSDMPRLLALAERSSVGRRSASADVELAQGLAQLRTGHFAKAIDLLRRGHDSAPEPMSRAASGCYLALALHHHGTKAEAEVALASALAEFDKIPRIEDGDAGGDCEAWLVCQIARREAEAALRPALSTTANDPRRHSPPQ